jgi:hypothetical protein
MAHTQNDSRPSTVIAIHAHERTHARTHTQTHSCRSILFSYARDKFHVKGSHIRAWWKHSQIIQQLPLATAHINIDCMMYAM